MQNLPIYFIPCCPCRLEGDHKTSFLARIDERDSLLSCYTDDTEFYQGILFSLQGPDNAMTLGSAGSTHSEPDEEVGPSDASLLPPILPPGKPFDKNGSERLLAKYGLSVYYRGLSNTEYAALQEMSNGGQDAAN
jgi:hypothetical protein